MIILFSQRAFFVHFTMYTQPERVVPAYVRRVTTASERATEASTVHAHENHEGP